MKAHLELIHQIEVLHNWAVDPRDTISALAEKQAREAVAKLKALWEVLDRRKR